MNRRDIIICFLVLIWGLFVIFILPTMAATSLDLMICFMCSMIILLSMFGVLIVISLAIKNFGEWGDKKLFKE